MNTLLMDQAAKLVETEVLACQTNLVWECITKRIFSYDELINDIAYVNKQGTIIEDEELEKALQESGFEQNHEKISREIFSWYLVTDWFAECLEKYGEPILRNDYGVWWGRTTFGQMICADYVIQKIAQEIYRED